MPHIPHGSPAPVVMSLADQYAVEPRFEASLAPKAIKGLIGFDKGILGHVFSSSLITAHKSPGETSRSVPLGHNKRTETDLPFSRHCPKLGHSNCDCHTTTVIFLCIRHCIRACGLHIIDSRLYSYAALSEKNWSCRGLNFIFCTDHAGRASRLAHQSGLQSYSPTIHSISCNSVSTPVTGIVRRLNGAVVNTVRVCYAQARPFDVLDVKERKKEGWVWPVFEE